MPASKFQRKPALIGLVCALLLSGLAGPAWSQGIEAEGRPIREVRILGLDLIQPQLVQNAIRSEVGRPYDPELVEQDVVRMTNLGYFSGVTAYVDQEEDGGGVILTYQLTELPILTGVRMRGNQAISTEALYGLVGLRSGDAIDPFIIDRAKRSIIKAYEAEGYFVTDVKINEEALDSNRLLIFEIREGPKIRIRGFKFEGNQLLSDSELKNQVKSRVWFPIIADNGVVNRDELRLDAARIRDHYQSKGYLEAEVDRRIDVADNQRDAIVTFVVHEGQRWTVGGLRFENINGGPLLFSDRQLALYMTLRPGDIYSARELSRSYQSILDLYGQLGYLDTRIIRRADRRPGIDRLFNPDDQTVDLLVRIDENTPTMVGKVTVRGNSLTRTKVILRETRGLTPGRAFDRTGLEETRRRLNESVLFRDATVTLLGEPGDPERDVIIQVTERNTGSIQFGATVSSDAGLLGAIEVTQRNFDVTDLPESWGDLASNRAFRGAGQTFNLTLAPGSENSRYSISLSDPYFLDTDYIFDSSLFFTDSERDDFDQRRSGGTLGLGKRFGDVWSAGVSVGLENVRILDIAGDGSIDVFEVEGSNLLTSVGFRITRSTADSRITPSSGSRTSLRVEQVGALGGDYDFTKARLSFDKFWTVDEDFLGRKSIISARFDAGYIFQENEAPIFERFNAGGHTSLRGFRNRGIGPRGIRADTLQVGDDPVGGDWLLLAGLQYEFPLVGDNIRGVIFSDQGTLTNDVGVDDWRVSVGTGIRLNLPFLGQAPFALDFAIPLTSEDTDEERLISFAIDIPFQ